MASKSSVESSPLRFIRPAQTGWYFIYPIDIVLENRIIGKIGACNLRDENQEMIGIIWRIQFKVVNPFFNAPPEKYNLPQYPFKWTTLEPTFKSPLKAAHYLVRYWDKIKRDLNIFKDPVETRHMGVNLRSKIK